MAHVACSICFLGKLFLMDLAIIITNKSFQFHRFFTLDEKVNASNVKIGFQYLIIRIQKMEILSLISIEEFKFNVTQYNRFFGLNMFIFVFSLPLYSHRRASKSFTLSLSYLIEQPRNKHICRIFYIYSVSLFIDYLSCSVHAPAVTFDSFAFFFRNSNEKINVFIKFVCACIELQINILYWFLFELEFAWSETTGRTFIIGKVPQNSSTFRFGL